MVMKRAASWLRRRLLVRVMIARGVRISAGDTVIVSTDVALAKEQVAALRAAFQSHCPGVKFIVLSGLGRVTVLTSNSIGEQCGDDGAESGEGSSDEPVIRPPD